MGTESLPKLATAPTLVPATTTQYNKAVDALQGDIVMRDSDGDIVDGAGDVGQPTSGRPDWVHVKTGITIGGQVLETSGYLNEPTALLSGKTKTTSGYPDYLSVTGAVTPGKVTILGASTNLEMSIDGELKTLEVNLQSDTLAAAPATNNTCLVNGTVYIGDFGKLTGEYGGTVTVDTMGSEITAKIDTVQCFKKGSEYFLAYVISATSLRPILRGIGGTTREELADNAVIYIMKAHYIFLDNNLSTVYTTTNCPIYSSVAPTSGMVTGDCYFNLTEKKWYRYSGSTWEALGLIYLGFAVTDGNGYCLVSHPADFDILWRDELLSGKISVWGNDKVLLHHDFSVNVCSEQVFVPNHTAITIGASTLETGVSETASTWYFLYVDKNGTFKLSDKFPRIRDKRLGWYHPSEYWRCVFMVYNNASSNFESTKTVLPIWDTTLTKEIFVCNANISCEVPIGTILFWHKALTGCPSLPDNFVECSGQTLNDPQSPFNGQVIPDINGSGYFLRGSATSGTTQTSQNKQHTHTQNSHNHTQNPHSHDFNYAYLSGGVSRPPLSGSVGSNVTTGILADTTATNIAATATNQNEGGTEARPVNISMVAIMRVK